jgi:hypothetical protein
MVGQARQRLAHFSQKPALRLDPSGLPPGRANNQMRNPGTPEFPLLTPAFRRICKRIYDWIVGLTILGLLLTTALVAAPAFADETQFPKGFRVGLVPPAGLVLSGNFVGFEDSERKVTIGLFEFPAQAYYGIEAMIFRESASLQIVVDRRELLPLAGGMGVLVSGHGEIEGLPYRKWLLVTSGPDITAVVRAQAPDDSKETYPDAAMRASLASVALRPPPLDEQLSLLPFQLDELAGFRVMRVLPEGAIVLTDGPRDDQAVEQPHLIASVSSGGPDQSGDRATFAQRLLTATPGFIDMRLTGSEPMRISGRPGHEVRAEARDAVTGAQVQMIQWLRFGSGGFLRIVGFATKARWAEAYPRFRAVRDGIELH